MSYIHLEADDSCCCSGYEIEYWWVNGKPVPPRNVIEHILDLIEAELTRDDHRHWTERTLDDAIGRLEGLLLRASQGRLVALGEIKSLKRPLPRRMFEIRADVGTVRVTRMAGKVVATNPTHEPLRIYHGETSEYPLHAFGVHLHLKDVDGDVEAKQNIEIDTAIERLDAGQGEGWGLPH